MEGGEIHGWEFKQEEIATPHMRDEGELCLQSYTMRAKRK